jgi:hypothetical protein
VRAIPLALWQFVALKLGEIGASLKVTPGVQVDQDQFHCLNRA